MERFIRFKIYKCTIHKKGKYKMKSKKISISIVILLTSLLLSINIPATNIQENDFSTWDKIYGGEFEDRGRCIVEFNDKNYIITGSYGKSDGEKTKGYCIIIDQYGNMKLNKTIGEDNEFWDAEGISEDSFIVTGRSGNHFHVYGLNTNGYLLGGHGFGGSSWHTNVHAMVKTNDGGLLFSGFYEDWYAKSGKVYTYYGILIILKNQGVCMPLTKSHMGDDAFPEGRFDMKKTNDGGYILLGNSKKQNNDIVLMKLDNSYSVQWEKRIGGEGSETQYSVQQTDDNGFIITGYIKGYRTSNKDLLLIKTDPSGNTLWSKNFGGRETDEGHYIVQTDDGGYLITGNTSSYGLGKNNLWLLKTDENGTLEWDKTFGEIDDESNGEYILKLDDGFFVLGNLNSDIWLLKTDENGKIGSTPSIPTIDGPKKNAKNNASNYTISSTDSDGDNVYYYIDWGDKQYSDWFGPFESDEEVTVEHTYGYRDDFQIKVKSRDKYGLESDWGVFQTSIAKNKRKTNSIIDFFDSLPLYSIFLDFLSELNFLKFL